uniref:(northern house mosquito) hypothetical protein n=1 Tax=Culex pipiens TaxID=7175 RepID=A0A8D8FP64_CULPI
MSLKRALMRRRMVSRAGLVGTGRTTRERCLLLAIAGGLPVAIEGMITVEETIGEMILAEVIGPERRTMTGEGERLTGTGMSQAETGQNRPVGTTARRIQNLMKRRIRNRKRRRMR